MISNYSFNLFFFLDEKLDKTVILHNQNSYETETRNLACGLIQTLPLLVNSWFIDFFIVYQ